MIRRTQVIGSVSCILALAFALPAGADIISFQNDVDGYTGTDDNHLYSSSLAARNSGASTAFLVGVTSNGTSERRAILRFDVSALAGQYNTIESARLELTGTGSGDYPDFTLNLYQIADANAGWVEGAGNFENATDGESAWRSKADGPTAANRVPWAGSTGLRTAGTDYLAPALDTITYGTDDPNGTVYTFDLTPALIDHWVTGTNAGLLLALPDLSTDRQAQFWSSDYASVNASYAPRLVVEFTPVPEPASAILIGAGAVCLISRRRK